MRHVYCIVGSAAFVVVSYTLVQRASAQCGHGCIEVDKQVGKDAGGDIYCHKFSAKTALYLYAKMSSNNDTASATYVTIQRWRRLNCCSADCSMPSTMSAETCNWITSSDWSQHECVGAE